MIARRIHRRTLLRGAGVGIALPFLEAMRPRRAGAQVAPRRFVVFFTANGTNNEADFEPDGTGAAFTLGKEPAPLEAVKSDLLVVSKLANPVCAEIDGDQHTLGMACMLTAETYALPAGVKAENLFHHQGGGPSIDQRMGELVGGKTRFPTVELGVQCTGFGHTSVGFTRMCWKSKLVPVAPIEDPKQAFTRLFADLTVGSPMPAPMVDVMAEQRRSILDLVRQDVDALRPRVSAADRVQVDSHLQSIRELEKRLGGQLPAASAAAGCAKPPAPDGFSLMDPAAFPVIGKLQMDLLVMALRCDLTRVASLQWSDAQSNVVMKWAGVDENHHEMSHTQGSDKLSKVNTWYAEQLLYLGNAMKAIDEGGTSLLSNSVVWWCSENGYGRTHTHRNNRVYLLGSCGGYFKTGQHVVRSGEPLNKLMVSFLHAMGQTDQTTFGSTKFGTGPLAGIT